MNRKIVFNITGRIMCVEAVLLLIPALVSVIYREDCIHPILFTACIAAVLGLLMILITNKSSKQLYAREGFAIVSLSWVLMAAVGALPFVFSGEIKNYADAFFEVVSGFTTTGATILNDVECMSKGLLFWRSFTHWIGGMGVLVLIMAIIPNSSEQSMHVMRAEMPGPVIGKLVPRIKDTAKILYLIYIGLTALEAIFLLAGGMPLYDSIVHSLATAGTGGFSIKNDSIGAYSPYIQWVVAVFMLLFGVNFNLYYLILLKKFREAISSQELRVYFCIVLIATAIIGFDIYRIYGNLPETVRLSFFQVSSIITTTGYATADYLQWGSISQAVVFVLMFSGGCAGSTAGGLKLSRAIMMFKMVQRELNKLIHPRSVNTVHFEGKAVDKETLDGVGTYFICYMACILGTFLIISFEPFGIETNFAAAVSCFNNVGPCFGMIGPHSVYPSFSCYSSFSKIILSLAMLLGRLEIYPLILGFSVAEWKKSVKKA